jgi:hypothetical protein
MKLPRRPPSHLEKPAARVDKPNVALVDLSDDALIDWLGALAHANEFWGDYREEIKRRINRTAAPGPFITVTTHPSRTMCTAEAMQGSVFTAPAPGKVEELSQELTDSFNKCFNEVLAIARKHGVGQPCPLCTLRMGHAPGDAPSCHVCGAVMKRVTSQIGAALGWHECASCGASTKPL